MPDPVLDETPKKLMKSPTQGVINSAISPDSNVSSPTPVRSFPEKTPRANNLVSNLENYHQKICESDSYQFREGMEKKEKVLTAILRVRRFAELKVACMMERDCCNVLDYKNIINENEELLSLYNEIFEIFPEKKYFSR